MNDVQLGGDDADEDRHQEDELARRIDVLRRVPLGVVSLHPIVVEGNAVRVDKPKGRTNARVVDLIIQRRAGIHPRVMVEDEVQRRVGGLEQHPNGAPVVREGADVKQVVLDEHPLGLLARPDIVPAQDVDTRR